MNPFLDTPVAQPQAVPRRIRSPQSQRKAPWRQLVGGLTLAAGVGWASAAPAPPAATTPINVNVATVAQLVTIKGIGPKTAALIVSERERAGPYVSFQDFSERIRGIGPKRAAALQAAGVAVSSNPGRSSPP